MIGVVLAAMLFGAAGSATNVDATRGPAASKARSETVTNPDWLKLPSGDDFAANYPPLALALELEGRAVIECDVNEVGRLELCSAIEESPIGIGFGPAAVSIADAFQMKPRLVNGRPSRGSARIPITYNLPESEDEPSAAPTLKPTPPAQSLLLARRLIEFSGAVEQATRTIEQLYGPESDLGYSGADPAFQEDVKAIMLTLFNERRPHLTAEAARLYAETFTLSELQGIVGFMETPAGMAFREKAPLLAMASVLDDMETAQAMQAELKRRFCAKHVCKRVAAAERAQ